MAITLPLSSTRAAIFQAANAESSVTYQGTASHSGNIEDSALKLPLKQLWATDLGGSVSYPVVGSNKVFVTVAGDMSMGPYGSKLIALDERTGDIAWGPVSLGGTYWWSALAYDNGKVFAVNYDGLLRAYDAATGTPAWSAKMGKQRSFSGPPTALNGIVYLVGQGSGSTLFAVSGTNGQVMWTVDVGSQHGSPAVTNTAVYIGSECSRVTALSPKTGTVLWDVSDDCDGSFGAATVFYNDKVYVRSISPGNLLVADAKTGKKFQIYETKRMPVFEGSYGFIFTDSTLQAFEEATGRVVWSYAGDGDLASNPFVANGTLYIASTGGKLYGLDPATGAELFTAPLPAAAEVPDDWNGRRSIGMGVGNGTLFVPATNWLVAFVSQPEPAAQTGCRTFAETGKTVCGTFNKYWQTHGGVAQQGLPISVELQEKSDTDGKTYPVQYFERAVFEYHGELGPQNDVLLSLLGTFRYSQKYRNNATGQIPNTEPGVVKFSETGKSLGGRFLQYWKTHGGLPQQGFPISDEFLEKSDLNGKNYLVQYFQRSVFEYHPEYAPPNDVLLSQLGSFRYGRYQGANAVQVTPAKTPVP